MADTRRLPGPQAERWEWQLRGSCRGMDSAFFFHPDDERGVARAARESRAKQICARCAVLDQCRQHALRVREPYGIWGGLTEHERRVLLRNRDRTLRMSDITDILDIADTADTADMAEECTVAGAGEADDEGCVRQAR